MGSISLFCHVLQNRLHFSQSLPSYFHFTAAIATELQGVYNSDSAVAGEAASIATGLVMLGSADEEVCRARGMDVVATLDHVAFCIIQCRLYLHHHHSFIHITVIDHSRHDQLCALDGARENHPRFVASTVVLVLYVVISGNTHQFCIIFWNPRFVMFWRIFTVGSTASKLSVYCL